jgi:hypothetical protein
VVRRHLPRAFAASLAGAPRWELRWRPAAAAPRGHANRTCTQRSTSARVANASDVGAGERPDRDTTELSTIGRGPEQAISRALTRGAYSQEGEVRPSFDGGVTG